METALGCMEASYLVWDNIWKKDAPPGGATELNILDVVQLSADRVITGWLFTSSTGVVKSKLVSNWRTDAILHRCSGFERDNLAFVYNNAMQSWVGITNADKLAVSFTNKGSDKSALIIHPNLTKTSTFMEVSCVKSQKNNRVEVPVFFHNWLCDIKKSGRSKYASLPSQSIPSMDKEANTLAKEYMLAIIKLLETNERIKVTGIKAVLVFDATHGQIASNSGGVNGLDGSANISAGSSKITRLHHVTSLTYRSVAQQPPLFGFGGSGDGQSEVNSSIADMSLGGGSLAASSASKACRVDCCHGDFCQFITEDASDPNGGGGTGIASAFDLDDDFDGEFNIKNEASKAVNRHRPVRPDDHIEVEESSAEKMDLFRGQTDHLIAKQEEERKLRMIELQKEKSARMSGANSTSGAGGDSFRGSSMASTSRNPCTLRTLRSQALSEQVKRTEKKLKVMSKSIALARQEMEELRHRDMRNLNSAATGGGGGGLGSFTEDYRRSSPSNAGGSPKSRGRGPGSPGRQGSSHSFFPPPGTAGGGGGGGGGSGSSAKLWPAALTKWWLNVGCNLPRNSLSVMVPVSAASNIDRAALGNTTAQAELGEANLAKAATAALFEVDLSTNESELLRNAHFGWYYTPVRVCERCHKVYTDLDRRRKRRYKQLIQKQKEKIEANEDEQDKWREVEARIFKQRQAMSRLAKVEDSASLQEGSMLAGANSLAFDSVAGDGSGGVAFGRAYKNASRSQQQGTGYFCFIWV
jgi:hypothetical protein